MKTYTFDLNKSGATLHIVLPPDVDAAQITVTAPEGVDVRLVGPAPVQAKVTGATTLADYDLDFIAKRLIKVKPNKRATALNAIKAMFQHDRPMTDAIAEEVLEALRQRKVLAMDEIGRIKFPV